MGKFVIQQGQFFNIKFPFDPILKEAAKRIPDSKFNPGKKYWVVPAKHRIAVERFAYAYGFTFAAEENWDQVPELPFLNVELQLKRKLYPYQERGVAYNLIHERVLIGDKPGLGKTAQSIATLIAAEAMGHDVFPCIVVCPSGLKENWLREWHAWSNKKAIVLRDSIKNNFQLYYQSGMADVFIVNYESLKKYFVKYMPSKKDSDGDITIKDIIFKDEHVNFFKSLIADESHKLKSFTTQQTKFVRGLSIGKRFRILCSGTPIKNKPSDLAPQIGILDQFPKFGGYDFFLERYCSGPKKASNLKELNYKLNTICFYQRLKSEVLTDLPDKVRQKVYCDMSAGYEALYAKAEHDFVNFLTDHTSMTEDKIDRSMRAEALVKMQYLKYLAAMGKLESIFEQVDSVLESGEKMVLYASRKDVVAEIKKRYPKAVAVTGEENDRQKQHSVDQFQTNPEVNLIIISDAGGVGLTLTAASIIGMIMMPWTPGECEQIEDRCHRIGQKDSVQAMYFLANNTIDDKLYGIIDAKRQITALATSEEDIEENVVDNLINLFTKKEKAV